MSAKGKLGLSVLFGLGLALALSQGAFATPPDGDYEADDNLGRKTGDGQKVFDFNLNDWEAYIGDMDEGADVTFWLEMDAQGKLYGEGMAEVWSDTFGFDEDLPAVITGKVTGVGASTKVELTIMVAGDIYGDPFTATVTAKLAVDYYDFDLFGTASSKAKWGKDKMSMKGIEVYVPEPSDFTQGHWTMYLGDLAVDGTKFVDGWLETWNDNEEMIDGIMTSGKYDPKWDTSKMAFGPYPDEKQFFKGCYLKLSNVQCGSFDDLTGIFELKLAGQTRKGAFTAEED